MIDPFARGGEDLRELDFFGVEVASYARISIDPEFISKKNREPLNSEHWQRLYSAGVGLAYVYESYDNYGIAAFVIDDTRPEIYILRTLKDLERRRLLSGGHFSKAVGQIAHGKFEEHWKPFYPGPQG